MTKYAASTNARKGATARKSSSGDNPSDPKRPRNGPDASGGKPPNPGPVRIVSSITPNKSPRDPNEYRVIKLSTGLTVALISRKNPPDYGTPYGSSNLNSRTIWPLVNGAKPECHFFEPTALSLLECAPSIPTLEPECINGPSSTIYQRTCTTQQDTTSVAAVISAGGINDPKEWQGLAHFTEHMVHYGAKKFPSEDAVNVVLANFGTYNATTRQETTSYYNEVPDVLLDKNLELFADMLTQPLFSLEVLNREVNAVDNEFYLRMPSWRKLLLQIHVGIKGDEHPMSRFICGSLETLGNGTEGKRVQNAMVENHKKNYVASAMTVSINSKKSLEELEVLALRYFSNFLQGERPIITKTMGEKTPPLVIQGNQYVYLQGLSNRAELSLLWYILPSAYTNNPQERVIPLISRMLTDTNVGGLDYNLRSQELVTSLDCNCNTTNFGIALELMFSMTDKGRENTAQIVQVTFEYLNFLRNGSHEAQMGQLFEEMRIQNLKDYHYRNQTTSLETTKDFAMRLQYIDNVSEVLSCESWRDSRFNFQNVRGVLAQLTENNLIIIETLKKGVKLEEKVKGEVKTAPYTGAKYIVRPRNKDGRPSSNGNGRGQFSFVPKNKFLTLDVRTMAGSRNDGNGSGDAASYVLRCPDNCGDIKAQQLKWRSRNDPSHGEAIPKISGIHHGHSGIGHDPFFSSIRIQFLSPILKNYTATIYAQAWLWTIVIRQNVHCLLSEVFAAGFDVSIHPGAGVTISIHGFPRLMDQVVNTLVSKMFEKPITPKVFSCAKQQLYEFWESILSDSDNVANFVLHCSLYRECDMSVDFLGCLQEVTVEQLNVFIQAFKRSAFAFVELGGNLPLKTFESIASHLEKMPFAPIMDNNPHMYSPNFLHVDPDFYSPGETCIRVKNMSSYTYTTSVTNMYVLGPYGTNQRQADLFSVGMSFMHCDAFLDLRTKQQLGYVVYVRRFIQQKVKIPVMMFAITVTSTAKKVTACELDQKIDQFLADYAERIAGMKPELFQTMIQLTCTPSTVTQHDVALWFRERFSEDFGKRDISWKCAMAGIKKQSIQVLSGNEDSPMKLCKNCPVCSSIGENDWKPGSSTGSQLLFAEGKGVTKDYFISSPKF